MLVAAAGVAVRALAGMAAPGEATRPTYDETDLARVDYSGLPAPTMDVSHLGLVVNRRTAEAIGSWLQGLP